MGYTHYFPQQESISEPAWDKICEDTQKIITAVGQLECNDEGDIINKERINFNGIEDEAHETFEVTRKRNGDFNFCKTNRKHYDLAVMATLMVVDYHAPGALRIGSDGHEEWQEAVDFNQKLLGHAMQIPEGV